MGRNKENVAFIGLGAMGLPMARRLIGAGHSVTVHDRSTDAYTAIAEIGGKAADSAAAAAKGADFLILMLPTIDIVDAVLEGAGQALAALPQTAIVVNMSTVSPSQNRALSERVTDTGRTFIEAPVARGPDHAAQGTLSILVGGPQPGFDRVLPLMQVMGESVLHCGDVGSASALKLATNYLGLASNIAAAEALAFARCFGVGEAEAIDFMMQTAAGKGYLGTVYPNKVLAGDLSPGFPAELALKDLGLALQSGRDAGLDLVIGDAITPLYAREVDAGRGRNDLTGIYRTILSGIDSLSGDDIQQHSQ